MNEIALPDHRPTATTVVHTADARAIHPLADHSVDLIVTSPPYWKRRDYGHPNQIGQEETPQEYVRTLVQTINSWKRFLKPTSSLFLNLGDSYAEGFLVGVPALFEVAIRDAGWKIANQIVWTKTIGMPEANAYRLASRHEPIYHLTLAKKPTDFYFDMHALSADLGRTANPGDAWESSSCASGEPSGYQSDAVSDVWPLFPSRSRSQHIAPFPQDLARRAILLACPERVCTKCGVPYRRLFEASPELDPKRPQSARAMVLFREAGLTNEHFAAIRAVGISDAGKGQRVQLGSGRNSDKDIETWTAQNNVLAVLYDIAPKEKQQAIIDTTMAQTPWHVRPYFMFFVLDAITHAGLFDTYGTKWMRTWEIVPETQTVHEMGHVQGDLSHDWIAAPLIQMSETVLGITPLSPAYQTFAIRPHLCDLAWAKGSVPSAQGLITVSWQRTRGGGFTLSVAVPPGTESVVTLPGSNAIRSTVTAEGKPCGKRGRPAKRSADCLPSVKKTVRWNCV